MTQSQQKLLHDHHHPQEDSNSNMGSLSSLSPSQKSFLNPHQNPLVTAPTQAIQLKAASRKPKSLICQAAIQPPIVVVGSANADIYVEIDRLPKKGETISAKTGQTLAGGKGANQAVCGGKLSYPTYFLGQIGEDAHGILISDALKNGGVSVDCLNVDRSGVPTGHAVVMLQSDGENSIIIVGGANMVSWPESLSEEVIRSAGIVLLQREIPDFVNLQVAKVARSANVPVILDAGGIDAPIPTELLQSIDILSPNETELARLTNMPTESFEQISQAVLKCHKMGVKHVLVKLGEKGSALFTEGEEPLSQPIISAPSVIDTTGAGDTFTTAFAVAFVEGKSMQECLRFAAAAASLCVQVKGAIPSMPDRNSVESSAEDLRIFFFCFHLLVSLILFVLE